MGLRVQVKQLPGKCVRAYVRSNKTDATNAAALPKYPDCFEVRYVSANGGIRWNKSWINVSIVCVGEYVGLEEIDDGVWNVSRAAQTAKTA